MNEITTTIDFKRVENCFRRSIETYNQHAVVQRKICDQLLNLAQEWLPTKVNRLLEIGAGTGLFTQRYLTVTKANELFINDLVAEMEAPIQKICNAANTPHLQFLTGDAQTIDLPQNIDVIMSASTLQWFANLDTFFAHSRALQQQGGLFVFSTFGPKNMIEICTLCKQGLHYLSTKELLKIISPYYEILCLHEEQHSVFFDTATNVLQHIKRTGVNGLTPQRWTRQSLQQFEADYCSLYQSSAGLSLTYHPIYVVCKAK